MTENIVARLRGLPLLEQGALCAEAADEIERLRAALSSLIKINDEHSPFGGEIYRDRIERTWEQARSALAGEKTND